MPLYEYSCRDCGHRFEVLQRLGDGADRLVCPSCAAPRPEKQFSTFSAATATVKDAERPAPVGGCCRGTPTCPLN